MNTSRAKRTGQRFALVAAGHQLEAEVRDARCCEDLDRCPDCQAKVDEVRAVRRDAVLLACTFARPRRAAL